MDQLGRVIGGQYRLDRVLGAGGSGQVWEAYDLLLQRRVAIKEIHLPRGGTAAEHEEVTRAAVAEARRAGRLSHRNIVSIYNVILDDDRPWIVMQLIVGRTLLERVTDAPLSAPEAARVGLALLDALAAAHRADVVHRDVKPSNVLIDMDDWIYLTDFSIASATGSGTRTQAGVIVGTPGFISPERILHGHSGPEADMFGLGATLYFAVEGVAPFDTQAPLASATVEPPVPGRARAMTAVIMGLLRKDPAQRLTADAARPMLTAALAAGNPPAPPRVPAPTLLYPSVPDPAVGPHRTVPVQAPVASAVADAPMPAPTPPRRDDAPPPARTRLDVGPTGPYPTPGPTTPAVVPPAPATLAGSAASPPAGIAPVTAADTRSARRWLVPVTGGVLAVLLAAVIIVRPWRDDTTPPIPGPSCDVRLAFMADMRSAARGGTALGNGARLAIKRFTGANPNCHVTLLTMDTEGEVGRAEQLARDAVADRGVVGVIGPMLSAEVAAAVPILETGGLPMITPFADDPALARHSWRMFHRGVGDYRTQGPKLGAYIRTLPARAVYLVHDGTDYAIGLTGAVRDELGSAVVGTRQITRGTGNYPDEVAAIVASGATVVFFGGERDDDAGSLLRQLRDRHWQGTFIGGDAVISENMLTYAGRGAAEGSIASCVCVPSRFITSRFVEAYRAEFGAPPGAFADVAYDVTDVFLRGIAAGEQTRTGLAAWLDRYREQGWATGVTYAWGDDGELTPGAAKVWLYRVVDGDWVPDPGPLP